MTRLSIGSYILTQSMQEHEGVLANKHFFANSQDTKFFIRAGFNKQTRIIKKVADSYFPTYELA